MMTWTVRFKGRNGKPAWAVVSADTVATGVALLKRELAWRNLDQEIKNTDFVPMTTCTRKCRILMDDEDLVDEAEEMKKKVMEAEAEHKNDLKAWEKACFGDSAPQAKSESSLVTISVPEFALLNRRVGFLEGVLETLLFYPDSVDEVIERAMEKYKEICAER